MKYSEPPILLQHCFRRRNYGDRANEPIDDLLVVIDLLTAEPKESKKISRKVLHTKNGPVIVYKKKNKDGEQKFVFRISHEVLDTLRELHLIRWRYWDKFPFMGAEITIRRTTMLANLLALHDEMHVGQTKHLHPGIYQYYKGEDNTCRVDGVTLKEDGILWVTYEQLHGKDAGKTQQRPLSMFTQVIHRNDYVGPRWRLIDKEPITSETKTDEPLLRIVYN